MESMLIIPLAIALGLLMKATGMLTAHDARVVDVWVLRVALPAIVLEVVPKLTPRLDLLLPALSPWIVAVLTLLWLGGMARRFGASRAQEGALVLTAMLGNTAFVGLAALDTLLGPAARGPAIVSDQLGSFLVMSTLGLAYAGRMSSGNSPSARDIALRLARFPPFIALGLALIMSASSFTLPSIFTPAMHTLGETLVPLALFSVGLRVKFGAVRTHARLLTLGLFERLILGPAVVALFAYTQSIHDINGDVAILQAGMPPMVTASIIAAEYELDTDLATLMVSIGLIVSSVTLPLWAYLIT